MTGSLKESLTRSHEQFGFCTCRFNLPPGTLERTASLGLSASNRTLTHGSESFDRDELSARFRGLYASKPQSGDFEPQERPSDPDSPVASDRTELAFPDFLEGIHCSSCDKPLLIYSKLDFKLFDNWIHFVFHHHTNTHNLRTVNPNTNDRGDGPVDTTQSQQSDVVKQNKCPDSTRVGDLQTTQPNSNTTNSDNLGESSVKQGNLGELGEQGNWAESSVNIVDREYSVNLIEDVTSSILMSSEESLFQVVNEITPGEHCTSEKNQLFDSVKRFLQYCLGEETVVHLAGSTAYDIDVDYSGASGPASYSDLDIVLLSPAFGGDPRLILQKVYAELTGMQHVLKERNKCPIWVLADSRIKLVESAKVPIVIVETRNGLLCDISVNTLYPLLHAELFRAFIDERPVVRPLMRVFKHWLISRGLPTMKEGGFPSILWMSLFCNSIHTNHIVSDQSEQRMKRVDNSTQPSSNHTQLDQPNSHSEVLGQQGEFGDKINSSELGNLGDSDNQLDTVDIGDSVDIVDNVYNNMNNSVNTINLTNTSIHTKLNTTQYTQHNQLDQPNSNTNPPSSNSVNSVESSVKLDNLVHSVKNTVNNVSSVESSVNNSVDVESSVKSLDIVNTDNEDVEHENGSEYESYDDSNFTTFRDVYAESRVVSGVGDLWERLQGRSEDVTILCSLEKCFVNLSRGLSLMDIVNRLPHIKNGGDYGGMSAFCKNVIRLIEMEPNVPYGTWLVYFYELNRAKELMALYSRRLEMLVTLLVFLLLLYTQHTRLGDLKSLSGAVLSRFGYDLSHLWVHLPAELQLDTQPLHTVVAEYVINMCAILKIQLDSEDVVGNIKLLLYHLFQQFKLIPGQIFERVHDNPYSIPVSVEPPTPIEDEPNEVGHRSFESGLWEDSGWYIVVLQDKLCMVKVIKVCIEWDFWWSKDFVSRRDSRSIFHGFVYRQLRLEDSNTSVLPSILIRRGSLVLFNPCDIVSKLQVLKVVKHEQYISPSLYSTDFYTGVKCLYVLPSFEVERFLHFEQIAHKLKHYVEFRPQVTFCKLCGIVNMKKTNSYTEYKIPQRKLKNAKYVLCSAKYHQIYNFMQFK